MIQFFTVNQLGGGGGQFSLLALPAQLAFHSVGVGAHHSGEEEEGLGSYGTTGCSAVLVVKNRSCIGY